MDTIFKMIFEYIKKAYKAGLISKDQIIEIIKWLVDNYLDDLIDWIIDLFDRDDEEEEKPGSKSSSSKKIV